MSDLDEIGKLAGAILDRFSPAERRKLLRVMAKELQASQRARIASQTAPDGTPFPARKTKPVPPAQSRLRRRGTIKRGAMFRKLRLTRYLQAGASADEAWVGFAGRAARIANVHQKGELDRPSTAQKPVRYERRELLGLSTEDQTLLMDIMMRTVSSA